MRYSPVMATTTTGWVIFDSTCRASGRTTSPLAGVFSMRQTGTGMWVSDAIADSKRSLRRRWRGGLVNKVGAPHSPNRDSYYHSTSFFQANHALHPIPSATLPLFAPPK